MSGRGPKKERVAKQSFGRHSGWDSADDADCQSERFAKSKKTQQQQQKKGGAQRRQPHQVPGRAERAAAQGKMEKVGITTC